LPLIRNSSNPEVAKENLISAGWGLDEIQAKAILELRLQRLTGMEREKIKDEFDELMRVIARLQELLASEALRYDLIKTELLEIKEKFGDARKTEISYLSNEMRIEDLIEEEDVVITISHFGYIKRTSSMNIASRSGEVGVQWEPGQEMKILLSIYL
jgi:DNA gyrase subunit A